ncbi:unnamed protein product [Cuscuta epithymum]|uniref:F-box associated beta-propeller type 3 domain-containing protein n=1 Tax=Cuscuta epithymum TaxID=186058 RepID=A0AAV0G3R3_9ASTE|nr:unnamed protein product [Cuscuta epithymum]CAH9142491.1 unnamed protein product [Cuscuta epithymum]
MDLPKPKKRSNRLLLKQKKEVAEDEPKNRFGHLPPEIAKDILSRLPNVKSIIQFRSVCRSCELWSHDSHVFRMHFSRSSSTGSKLLYFYSSNEELHFVEFSDINEEGLIARKIQNAFVDLTPRSFWVYGSSNGIMILQDLHNWKWNCLYNPFTRDYKLVPELDGSSSFSYWWPACHPVTNDYKIFAIRPMYNSKEFWSMVYVYSMSRNEWTKLGEFSFKVEDQSENKGVLVNGRLHCLTVKGKLTRFLNITSIGIMDYSVKEVPMPAEVIFKNSKRSQLAVLGGCLSVGVRRVDSRMHIWVMKTYEMESSWVKQYVFGAEFLKFDRNWRSRGKEMLRIVCLLNKEEILLVYDGYGGYGQGDLISYNVVTKGYKTLTFGGTLLTTSFRTTVDTCCWSA